MKLFEYKVEPEQHAAMAYVTEVLDGLGVGRSGSIGKEALCKFMVSDRFAVHYAKQCTGEGVYFAVLRKLAFVFAGRSADVLLNVA